MVPRRASGPGSEGPVVELHAEIERIQICDDLARILAVGEDATDQFVNVEGFGPGDFDDAVDGRRQRRLGDRRRDILRRHVGWKANATGARCRPAPPTGRSRAGTQRTGSRESA